MPGNTLVKFEVRSFNRFKLVCLAIPLRKHGYTHTRTHIERKQYLRHSLRSLGGYKYHRNRTTYFFGYQISKTVKAAVFKFDRHVPMDSPGVTLKFFSKNGRSLGHVTRYIFLGVKC